MRKRNRMRLPEVQVLVRVVPWTLALTVIILAQQIQIARAAISCMRTKECVEVLRPGSECIDGFCSNPFRSGCLRTMGVELHINVQEDGGLSASHIDTNNTSDTTQTELPDLPKRSCNTDDVDEVDCQRNKEFQYPQVRIHNGNWESSIFFAWILQILSMEVLQAPITVGLTTETTAASSFYSPTNTLEYSSAAYPFEALRNAKGCHLHTQECAQVLPEVWNGQMHEWTQAADEGYIEPIEGNGQVGKGSWYVPKFTAERDDSLVSFYGLSGKSNRRKLAEAFLKPTTWLDYCELVSPNNCSTPDSVAVYFPNDDERDKYFVQGSFTGYFRVTPENNCTINPDTCMGHIVGPGCTWSTNIDAQLYWNDIQLKPDGPLLPNGGYEYSSLIEIWRAADATKSNVVFWWWRPEALVEEFHGTDSQFQQVLLPEATDICARARVDTEARCSEDINVRRGDPEGACDQEAHALQKVISKALAEETLSQPLVSRSPTLDLIKALKITDLEINHMLRRWIALKVDPYGNDAREAVCGWVVDNIDHLLDFIPPGYPKQLAVTSSYNSPFLRTAMAIGTIASLYILLMARLAYHWRNTKVFVYAQAHLVYLILFGFFLVAVGAIITSLAPTNGVCIARIWLVNLGYTIELVPLLVKIAAINRILAAASKLKRVKISRQSMFRQVGIIIALVATFLIVWTLVDPAQPMEERVIPDTQGFTVEMSLTCSSEQAFWAIIALGWQALLLLVATVLAFQSRDVAQEFNESQRLGTMIYSHTIFLILRAIVYFFLGGRQLFTPNIISGIMSMLLSFDTIFANIIYFLPKCLEAKSSPENYSNSQGIARNSAAVTAIEKKAAIAYNSHVSNTSHVSMIDATGSLMKLSQGNSSKRPDYPKAGSWLTNSPGAVRDSNTGSRVLALASAFSPESSSLRNRTANTSSLVDLREVSKESSDSGNSSSKKLVALGDKVEVGTLMSSQVNADALHQLPTPMISDCDNGKRISIDLQHLEAAKGVSSFFGRSNNHVSFERKGGRGIASNDSLDRNELFGNSDIDSVDNSSSTESVDGGGPRFRNEKANAELERSIQVMAFFE